MKKFLTVLLILVLVIVVAFGGLLGFLTVTEYRPADVESVSVRYGDGAGTSPVPSDGFTVLSWNIGYAGLGKHQDFFMDGGKKSRPGDPDAVYSYLRGIVSSVEEIGADLVILQEVDTASSRTYGIDETESLAGGVSAFALN